MFAWLDRTALMVAMVAAGLGLLMTPAVFGVEYPSAAVLSSGVLGAVMVLVGIGVGYGSLEWWARFALGIATWTFVAPMVLGFYEGGAAFWAHMAAGFIGLVSGVAGHELMVTVRTPSGRRSAIASGHLPDGASQT